MTADIDDRLKGKLSRIRSGAYKPSDFIIADAKDAEMGGGIGALGGIAEDDGAMRPATARDYRAAMVRMMETGLVDIMLTSLSSAEALHADGAFGTTDVTPAVRLNDATDIWGFRGAAYRGDAAVPFRTARLDQARRCAALGLYAVTFYNDRDLDVATLTAYRDFRRRAGEVGMAHFLEVFNPAFAIDTGDANLGAFINDAIVRCLAGVGADERPLFLKMQYNGARAMAELASHDPGSLIVGVLGGAAGTTRDTFELVAQTERFGGRVALFGRKIYEAEDSLEIVRLMRAVVERDIGTAEAVRSYHGTLVGKAIRPARPLGEDLMVSDPVLVPEAE
ncbi:MAG: hypothetical protein VXZ67_02905 [Pseudomonadota bacterium]|nr:hypothetical protein [Pseudomonadota bacterium]